MGIKKSFLDWTDKYLLRVKPLGCTAADLYGARCGLLHTFSADSKLSRQGSVRYIYYAWGTAGVAPLRNSIEILEKSEKRIAIHIGDLFEGWVLGVEAFLDDINNDDEKRSLVYIKAGRFFANIKPSELKSCREILGNNLGKQ